MGLISEQERRLDSDPTRTRCTHCISPGRRVRLTDEADRATASCSQYSLHPMWGATPDVGRYTLYVALHPLRGAAPDQKRCNAYGSGAAPLSTSTFADAQSHQSSAEEHTTQALHPLRRATPDVGRYTRCGALHPMWGATPDQKRCNAYGSGAAPHATSIFADARYSPDSVSAHLLPSPWTPATAGLTVTLQPQSHTAPSPAKIATAIGMLLTEQWMILITPGN